MNGRKIASLLAVAALCAGFLSPEYRSFVAVPTEVEIPRGEHLRVPVRLPGLGALSLAGARARARSGAVDLLPSAGRVELRVGALPVKTLRVVVVPQRHVRLGGQSIGVIARGRGAGVVGYGYFPVVSGGLASPAFQAGVRVGDRLTAVDGRPLQDSRVLLSQVERAGRAGRPLRLTVLRQGRRLDFRAQPRLDRQLARYRLGIYVRDRMVGVGTLTFSDPQTRAFAALGHGVDADAGGRLRGVIVPAAVVGVDRARTGRPGRKIGVLGAALPAIGRIERTSDVGIGGELREDVGGRLLPIATLNQVHPGPARLYTVLHGGRVRGYGVRIDRILLDRRMGAKAIALHVTDPRLIRETGGIVQGMSGSPLVQDGRLAGAVTHVLVHDPRRGYAVFAEWMYRDLAAGRRAADHACDGLRHGGGAVARAACRFAAGSVGCWDGPGPVARNA